MWSLERVAVVYGLQTIGNHDWYGWGAEVLVSNQEVDGSWQGAYGGYGADTCFALLFLRRANLVRDLTADLKGVEDPVAATLKVGGGSGEDLKAGKIKLDLSSDDGAGGDTPKKPPEEKTPIRDPAASDPPKRPTEDKPPPKPTPTPVPTAKDTEPDPVRLSDELVKAPAEKQGALLEKLRDSKGAVFTQALARAIPGLVGGIKTQARDALAERLTRMTAATLKDKLEDDDAEVRRAAVLAVAMKEETSLVPRLIEMLQDGEPAVSRAALAALKSLTNQDLGLDVKAWKAWAAKKGNK
jgi:hypothetical protein